MRAGADGALDRGCHFWIGPHMAVHEWLAVGTEASVKAEQRRMAAGRDQTAPAILGVDDPITREAVEADLGGLQALAGHRLDRIPPELGHAHRHALEMAPA
jgi:hypothetical protein